MNFKFWLTTALALSLTLSFNLDAQAAKGGGKGPTKKGTVEQPAEPTTTEPTTSEPVVSEPTTTPTTEEPVTSEPVVEEPTGEDTQTVSYTVQSGDTLWKISQTYGVTVEQIKSYNNLTSDVIYVGQILLIPTSSTPVVTEPVTNPQVQGYTFTGKGWGHGIGMTQYGAKGMADQGFLYSDILKYYYTNVQVSTYDTTNTNIRVALSLNLSSVSFSNTEAYRIKDRVTGQVLLESQANIPTTVKLSGTQFLVTNNAKNYYSSNPLTIESVTGTPIGHKGNLYLGSMEVSKSTNGGIDVINHVNVETYLRGVVPGEMYPSWHNEALKAQTLAARTYALKNRVSSRKFDVYDDTRSQVYKGYSLENAKVTSLIEATKGEVITYNGSLIDAIYSASAGGHTIDSEDLWNYSPYLRGKPDPYDTSVYVTNWWTAQLTIEQLSTVFTEVGKVTDIQVLATKYNRPTSIKVVGDKGEITVSGNTFRSRVGSSILKSTSFTFQTY